MWAGDRPDALADPPRWCFLRRVLPVLFQARGGGRAEPATGGMRLSIAQRDGGAEAKVLCYQRDPLCEDNFHADTFSDRGELMGSRGPLRKPTSVRGQREKRRTKATTSPVARPEPLTAPTWLPEAAGPTWRRVVAELRASGVSLERIDAEAIGFYVLCIEGARDAAGRNDSKLVARFSRDALQWAGQIGATPASRLRMNIKPAAPVEPDDPWAYFDN